MYCNQCEQTSASGCVKTGVCGKNEDVASLQDILLLGLKGISAYVVHAGELGYRSEEVDKFMHEGLYSTGTNVNFDANRFINLNLKAGEICLKAMELLDKANTETFGLPKPVEVSSGTVAGHGILVTGHDLLALSELLKQTEGKGINIYTHGEMLPAHGYPELKKYKHLAGNYGGSWVDQKKVFEHFSGAILGTTNCVVQPKDSYKDRMFTCGIAGLEGVTHIENMDFTPVIKKSLALPELIDNQSNMLTVGFHHSNVLALADKIAGAVKNGKIKHFFLVAGCDCPGNGMDYYAQLVKSIPDNCIILTLACGKFRFNSSHYGSIDGIPRLIDLGQCNNAYSAIKIASALAEVFKCSVNELPLSIVLSWFEQKAVAILLTLFHLGIKNIKIGPKPPVFVSSGVFKVLQDTFNLKLITDPAKDLKEMIG
ncbi:hydroxylamine reductase [Candidatus Desantisbacteria bacterium]|nr:hydroxylamine reductase [Candidatus Desantisbacteria bacterium]